LKNSLCYINANNGRVVHGGYLVDEQLFETSFWHIDAVNRGIHLITHLDHCEYRDIKTQ
jgi:hypothetical protein